MGKASLEHPNNWKYAEIPLKSQMLAYPGKCLHEISLLAPS
jgi:hypothetical protein